MAQWRPCEDTQYKIEYYYETLDGYSNTPDFTENREGTTDETAVATTQDKTPTIANYEFDENAQNILSGSIAGDGSLVLKVYFKLSNYKYKIEHYYEVKGSNPKQYELDSNETVISENGVKYGLTVNISDSDKKVHTGYKYVTSKALKTVSEQVVEGELPLTITENENTNVIRLYYDLDDYGYRIEHYYQVGNTNEYELDAINTDNRTAEYHDVIVMQESDKKLKDGYAYHHTENSPLTITENQANNVIKLYYKKQYNITTKVKTHSQEYVDGTIEENIKGGSISGDSLESYEKVVQGENNKQAIVITPDEGYEIVKITLKNGTEPSAEINYNNLINNGVVTIPVDYFTNMQSDKHIEVEFRKTTKVIAKYLEKTEQGFTENELADSVEITGYEGYSYETQRKADIPNYRATQDPEGNETPSNAEGTMKADTIIVKYYYERIPAGINVKYLEKVLDSNGKEIGVAIDGVDDENIPGYVGLNYETSRKTIDNYISTTPPELPSGTENVIYVEKDENSKNGTYTNESVEIVYWYERLNYITTEVKSHTENRTDETTGEKVEKQVAGGKNTGEDETPFETVIYNKKNKKGITIEPDENYIVKSIKLVSTNKTGTEKETVIYGDGEVQNAEIRYTENADGTITLSKFTNVQENKHIIVEFEPIIGTVIVHHYINGTGEEFNKPAVKVPSKEEGKVIENETLTDYVGENYATSESQNIPDIYELVDVSGQVSGEFAKNTINVYYYYDYKGYEYTVEYYYDGIKDDDKTDTFTEKYGKKIITYDDKNKTGYRLEKVEPVNGEGELELTITENPENNIIRIYYVKDNFNYTVEYYYDGIIDDEKTDVIQATYQDKITTYVDKVKDGYVKVDEQGLPLTISDDEDENIIRIYYRTQYNITTKVITHDEEYVDGTKVEDVKGGTISGDSEASYEKVLKGDNSTKAIIITPDDDYEIVKVTLKEGTDGENVAFDYSDLIENGVVTIPEEYFKDVQSDKHIEVEFRKKSKVVVKYLEKIEDEYTENELLNEDTITGYESEEYNAPRKDIPNYRAVEDEDGNITPENSNGKMKADTIEVIYYYEKIPAGVTVKHLEKITKPNGEVEGIAIEGVDDEFLPGFVGREYETARKDIDNYVSAEPPELDDDVENVIYIAKDKDSEEGTYTEDSVEIVYWYERQFKITTEVKAHAKTSTEHADSDIVKGGTISGDITEEENKDKPYEIVIRAHDNTKQIEIIPDSGYKVKTLTINGELIETTNLEKENHTIVLPKGYFKDIQEDKHVVVEFEQIPASLVVKYIDVDTKEEIIPTEKTDGFVNDEYSTERKEIENYIPADPEPENAKGKLVENGNEVIYYYTKQFKITTDVIEHYEFEDKEVVDLTQAEEKTAVEGGKILVKGGTISGEDEAPYEAVNRGKDSIKEIVIIPDIGYRIKTIKLIQPGTEVEVLDVQELFEKYSENNKNADNSEDSDNSDSVENSSKENMEALKQLQKLSTINLPSGYFTNMQSDKHLTVEFERIPAKVTVNFLDIETEAKVSKSQMASGYILDKYKTSEQEIPYYELVKEKYPENAEGVIEKEENTVTYWYRKLLFNMKITKELTSVQVNGTEKLGEDKKFTKIDISNTAVNNTTITLKYKVTVTNTEEIAGSAIIVEEIPTGFKFINKDADSWQEKNGKYEVTTKELQPGESTEYEIILEWDTKQKCMGTIENKAQIIETINIPQFKETTTEDNKDSCTVLISIKTGEDRTTKTIISIACYILAGICTIAYIITEVKQRRKDK